MLLPADRTITALAREFKRLAPAIADAGVDGSSAQAISHALVLLNARQSGGAAFVREQFREYAKAVAAIKPLIGEDGADALDVLEDAIAAGAAADDLDALEAAWRNALRCGETLLLAIRQKPRSAAIAKALVKTLVSWEAADLTSQLSKGGDENAGAETTSVTTEKLQAYLRDRTGDSDLAVSSLRALAGGFGKETYVFSVSGQSLDGDFVMRRDFGKAAVLANDCHQVAREYSVIRAVRERGFPAPEALWLDTEHALLPGGDFIVMRKAPGVIGGSVFKAQTEVPPSLSDTLAEIAARLHAMAPLRALGDLSESINPALWDLSRRAVTEKYIEGWRDFFLQEEHLPSPSLLAIYDWLLHNLPDRDGPASLNHGDIGFHNFLFHDNALSAVLDWEFAHIGDPAEDLGYIAVTIGGALSWDDFMSRYIDAGGDPVDDKTLHFFKVWAHARNASASNVLSARFASGGIPDLKVAVLPNLHFPAYLKAAESLIANAP